MKYFCMFLWSFETAGLITALAIATGPKEAQGQWQEMRGRYRVSSFGPAVSYSAPSVYGQVYSGGCTGRQAGYSFQPQGYGYYPPQAYSYGTGLPGLYAGGMQYASPPAFYSQPAYYGACPGGICPVPPPAVYGAPETYYGGYPVSLPFGQ